MDKAHGFDANEVLARRSLLLIRADGSKTPVVVEIGMPRPFGKFHDYSVPYKISGSGIEKELYAAGIDAIQSLQLVMNMIGADLAAYAHANGTIRWEGGQTEDDLGFPTS